MRAVAYCRVSTDEQAESGFSLQDQEIRIRKFCEDRHIQLLEIVFDDFTGKLLNRPGLLQVNALAETRSFDALVCLRLDRLARVNYLRRQEEEWLKVRGISVLYVEQSFEKTAAGNLQRGIMGEFAEYESELIRDRTMRGRIRKASEAGRVPTSCRTYGYHQISVAEARVLPEYLGRSGELVIVEEEAAFVRRIFELCARGCTLEEITRIMRDEGAQSRKGGLWRPMSIRAMLRNETYAGRLYYNRIENTRTGGVSSGGTLQKTRVERPKSDWILIPCPAIVDEAIFLTVQARLDYNCERLKGRRSIVWLLRGAVTCKYCTGRRGHLLACAGTAGRAKSGAYYRYYRCTSQQTAGAVYCHTIEPAEKLEGLALDELRRAANPDRLGRIARRDAEKERKQRRPGDDVERLTATLAALDAEESRLADVVLAGVSHTVIASKVEDIHRRRRALLQQLAQARAASSVSSPEEAARRGAEVGEWLRDALAEAADDRETLARLIRLFLRVRIYRGESPEIKVQIRLT